MGEAIVGADFYHNAKPLAQAYALAEIERLNLARELQELKAQVEKDAIWKTQVMNFLAEFGASSPMAGPGWSLDASRLFGYLSEAGWKGNAEK